MIRYITYEQWFGKCTYCEEQQQVHQICQDNNERKDASDHICKECLDKLRISIRGTTTRIHWRFANDLMFL